MGTRLNHDAARQVPQGTLQKAPRAGSEELVRELENMDVDSESKEKVKEEPQVKSEEDEETKAKHLDLVKRLQKLVREMILDQEKEVKKENVSTPMQNVVPVAAH